MQLSEITLKDNVFELNLAAGQVICSFFSEMISKLLTEGVNVKITGIGPVTSELLLLANILPARDQPPAHLHRAES